MSENLEDNTIHRIHVIYHGHVQGVGFRATAHHLASLSHLKNISAENLPDGTVEIFASGKKSNLNTFLENLQNHFKSNITTINLHFI